MSFTGTNSSLALSSVIKTVSSTPLSSKWSSQVTYFYRNFVWWCIFISPIRATCPSHLHVNVTSSTHVIQNPTSNCSSVYFNLYAGWKTTAWPRCILSYLLVISPWTQTWLSVSFSVIWTLLSVQMIPYLSLYLDFVLHSVDETLTKQSFLSVCFWTILHSNE